MARLELEELRKKLQGKELLSGASLSVERGETVAIYGPSGGGKTVLLNIISGALPLDDGDIRIDGKSVAASPPEHRNVGMAFQNFALYPHMTAFENIASPLRCRSKEDPRPQVEEIASLLKIGHVLDHVPSALSNGQKQRTSLARALVAAPAVLLLDDPLRNVDAKLRYEMRLEMPELFRRIESAVIYVTQDCREAMALADRIAILRDGDFVQVGPPEEVYDSPLDADVGVLLGEPTMNLLPCVARVGDGRTKVNPAQMELSLPARDNLADGKAYLAGVRPEDVWVTANGEAAPSSVPALIEAVTPTNMRSVLVLRGEDGTEIVAACDEDKVAGLGTGTRVRMSFDPAKMLLFDGDSRLLVPSVS